ncbi:MAG: DUF3179 domain-containing protein [Nitrospirota bacterium]|nr:DUF3179 domain-containing protein [Nitrospirota bacterium]
MTRLLQAAVGVAVVLGFVAVQVDVSSAMGKAPKKEDLSVWRVNPDEMLEIPLFSEDTFPPILEPKSDTVDKTPFADTEMVIGVVVNGEAKAYPIGILNYHEMVNDVVGKEPILVTYSLLGDIGMVFKSLQGTETLVFSNSGRLYRSNLVFYDGRTRSYWSQAWGMGIKGAHVNEQLTRLPVVRTTLGLWKKAHPKTLVLSKKTGSTRNYFKYPYGDYYTNERILYPVANLDKMKLHPKESMTFVAEPDKKVVQNSFSGAFAQFQNSVVKEKGFMSSPFGSGWVVALWDSSFETVRVYAVSEEVTAVSGSSVSLKSGKKAAVKDLKEMPSSRAFAFILPGLFQ